jgi:predicted amidohydrolase YtcJ
MTTEPAELILHGGTIYTLEEERPRARALSCRGGRLLQVGDDDEVLASRGPSTRCVHLAGRAVLPGFIDCHIHFTDWALGRRDLQLSDASSADAVAELVRRRAAQVPAGSWILGRGFDPNLWGSRVWPGRGLLDRAAPGHPVLLSSKDFHSCWASSEALGRAGISASTADPEGGRIEREPGSSEPNGILRERAMELLWSAVPEPTVEEAVAAIGEALPMAWAAGLTGVHEIFDTTDALSFRAWQQRRRKGSPGLRVYHWFRPEHLEAAAELGVETGFGDEWLRLGGVKLIADGTLGSRTAYLLEPYAGGGWGVPILGPAELRGLLDRAHRAGLAAAVHAIGDRANREVLDAFEAVLAAGRPGPRHRVEHVQLLHPDDVPRLGKLGLIASMQPIHAVSDMVMAEEQWGASRWRFAYAWRSLMDTGARLCFGSDAPVESFSVLEGLRAAVTRHRRDGSPCLAGWVPEQRIAVEQAVRAYTAEAAFASGEEALKGSLAPGKLADAVVLSDDIIANPDALATARVECTVLGGQIVHLADGVDL